MKRLPGSTFLLCLSVALVADVVHGQPDVGSDVASRAAAIKKRGDDAMDAGRPADALTSYVEAYALSKDPALLYNKGRALEALTEYPQALVELEAFDRTAPSAMKARVPGLAKQIAELRQRVTVVSFTCNVDGAEVRFRDRTIGRCPILTPLPVNAGKSTIDVVAEGYFPWHKDGDLPGGGTASFDIHLVSKATAGILVVKSPVANVDVAIDGKRVGTAPVEASLGAGPHTLELRREGYRSAKTSAVLAAGERRVIEVPLESEPGLVTRWWFWTGLGAVLAGSVAAILVLNTEKDPDRGTVPPHVVTSGLRF